MTGLAVVAGLLVGGVVGGYGGVAAALAFADMELGSLDALGFIAGGVVLGAVAGAYAAAEIAA